MPVYLINCAMTSYLCHIARYKSCSSQSYFLELNMLHSEYQISITNLFECIRFFSQNADKKFLDKNWTRQTLDHFLGKLQTTGYVKCSPGSSRPWLSSLWKILPQSQFCDVWCDVETPLSESAVEYLFLFPLVQSVTISQETPGTVGKSGTFLWLTMYTSLLTSHSTLWTAALLHCTDVALHLVYNATRSTLKRFLVAADCISDAETVTSCPTWCCCSATVTDAWTKYKPPYYSSALGREDSRATGNSRFENAKFPPAKEKIPENSRSVICLILHAVTVTHISTHFSDIYLNQLQWYGQFTEVYMDYMLLEVLSLDIYISQCHQQLSIRPCTCRDWPAAIDHRCINYKRAPVRRTDVPRALPPQLEHHASLADECKTLA